MRKNILTEWLTRPVAEFPKFAGQLNNADNVNEYCRDKCLRFKKISSTKVPVRLEETPICSAEMYSALFMLSCCEHATK